MELAEKLERYRSDLPGPHLEMVIASIVAGNTAGELWELPQTDASPLLLLWDKGNNVFYLAGDCHAQSSLASLVDILARDIRPRALAEKGPWFKVRALSPSLEQVLHQIFAGTEPHPYPTLFYTHAGAAEQRASSTLPGVDFTPITPASLAPGVHAHSEEVREEIHSMWPTEERFHECGLGVLAILNREIICWCTAEYLSPTRCGIGIATSPHYRRRGVATATAIRFVQAARERGITPCWECGRDNHPSVRVAEKAGFIREAEESYWVGRFSTA